LIFAVFLADFIFCTTAVHASGLETPITAKCSMCAVARKRPVPWKQRHGVADMSWTWRHATTQVSSKSVYW